MKASRGMALRKVPPSMEARRRLCLGAAWKRKRFRTLMALLRPVLISSPECPPLRPVTLISRAMESFGTSTSE